VKKIHVDPASTVGIFANESTAVFLTISTGVAIETIEGRVASRAAISVSKVLDFTIVMIEDQLRSDVNSSIDKL